LEESLTQQQLVVLLDQWVGDEIAVRVVSDSDDLIAVFQGRLCGRSVEKQPALFWPLHATDQRRHIEQPGISAPGTIPGRLSARGTVRA
jgi:hypothetical protein